MFTYNIGPVSNEGKSLVTLQWGGEDKHQMMQFMCTPEELEDLSEELQAAAASCEFRIDEFENR